MGVPVLHGGLRLGEAKLEEPGMVLGLGYWTRANAEVCLLGIRGYPRRMSASIHQVIEALVGRHSAKPADARERIVRLMGDLPRIELFAREGGARLGRPGM